MAMKPIPDGFVLLAQYDTRVGDEHKKGPRGDYAKLLRELAKDSPAIAAYKDGGQWVAREDDIKQFLAESTKPAGRYDRSANTACSVSAESICEAVAALQSIDSTLQKMAVLLELHVESSAHSFSRQMEDSSSGV